MSVVVYRKYRPNNFSEVIGQNHIVRTLSNAIKNNRVAHAYLFTGPRGTGKTTLARIFAKTLNCQNPQEAVACEKCPACRIVNEGKSLDIIEIDAASNTGVDNIRELKETIALPPTMLRRKVYIIDEVHMLSQGAFNALLKTLEEPPAHVVFVLATTELHKVPATIVSRCQRFDFPRWPLGDILAKLKLIAENEKIAIEKEALELIALSADGGMRDAESLLGQIISLEDKNVTAKDVREILGTADIGFVFELAEKIILKETDAAIGLLDKLTTEGYDLQIFTKTLINHFRQLMLVKINPQFQAQLSEEMTTERSAKLAAQSEKASLGEIIRAIDLLLESQNKLTSFLVPQLLLEIAIVKMTQALPSLTEKKQPEPIPNAQKPLPETPRNTQSTMPEKTIETAERVEIVETSPAEARPMPETCQARDLDPDNARRCWKQLLVEIRPRNHSLNAILANCQISRIEGNLITLITPYSFYKEKLEDPQNRLTVEDVFSTILKSAVRIQVEIDLSMMPKIEPSTPNDPDGQKAAETAGEQSGLLDSAMELMGGKIVE